MELAISIITCNVLVFCAWWVGIKIKENSEIQENSDL